VKEKGIRSRIKTPLRKAASLFRILGDIMISHETVRKYVPPIQDTVMDLSGYFVYDQQYVHIDGIEMAKKLIRFMFFQDEENIIKPGRDSESIRKLTYGKGEKEIVQIVMQKLNSLYGEDSIIRSFLSFVRKNRKEVFLYLDDPDVEKTSDKAEQHFSIQSWLLKHRFRTKDGLLRASYWYHW